jgi:hypothetical protein
MTYRLLNSAVMPVDGSYELHRLAITQFITLVREEKPISYIGYHECRDFLERICGVPIALNREITPVDDGDCLLIARLKYRVGNPIAKGQHKAAPGDYEFFFCRFQAHKKAGGQENHNPKNLVNDCGELRP